MRYPNIAQQIIELKKEDLRLRDKLIQEGVLGKGYHKEMKAVHDRNAKILAEIMKKIGYPTIDKVGKEANQAAYLVIQHAIGQPDFMKESEKLLEVAVKENQSDPKQLAYLSDRIAFFEQRPQLYGTQFDWDEKGELSPHPYDKLAKVNQRRAAIGLNSLEEQTQIIRKQAKKDKEFPPENHHQRKKEMLAWQKSVGWIK